MPARQSLMIAEPPNKPDEGPPNPSEKWMATLYNVGITKDQIARLAWMRWMIDTNRYRTEGEFRERLSD